MAKRAIIIDDERFARNELRKLLQIIRKIEMVAEATNAAEGIQKIDELQPDLDFPGYTNAGKNRFRNAGGTWTGHRM